MPLSGSLEPWRSVWKWTAPWFSSRKRFFPKTTQFATPKSKGPSILYHYYHSLWVAANGFEILWSDLSFQTRFFLSHSLTRSASTSLHSHCYLHLKDTVSPFILTNKSFSETMHCPFDSWPICGVCEFPSLVPGPAATPCYYMLKHDPLVYCLFEMIRIISQSCLPCCPCVCEM